ncbi:MAG: ParB/RepB/Spo0J family partition protein [Bacteroidota bacterium]
MEILSTTDYDQFDFIPGNRGILPGKVERLKAHVKKGLNLFPYCPIVVNEFNGKLLIIDGQHRFTACYEMDVPVYYVIAPEIKIQDIARMNSATDKWTYENFLQCYRKLSFKDYDMLASFRTEYKLSYNIAIALLMLGHPNARREHIEKFRDGTFIVNYEHSAVDLMKTVDRLFSEYVFNRDRNLIHAVHKLMQIGKWNIDTMEKKIQAHKNMMDEQTTAKNYMYLLEQIYNMRNQTRIPIL